MQELFLPDLIASYRWLSLCLIFGVVGVLIAILAFRQKNFPVRPLAQLMGMFVGMVGLAGAFFIFWNNARTPTVVVSEHYIILGNDTIPNENIKRAYIEIVANNNMYGQQTSDEIGILEMSDGRVQLFDSEVYELKTLIGTLQQVKK